MVASNLNQTNRSKSKLNQDGHSHVADAASQLLNEGKKLANEIYKDNIKKVVGAQDSIKEYSVDITQKVKANPLTSLLIAGGIGFILSALLRK